MSLPPIEPPETSKGIERTLDKRNTVCDAFDSWTLDNVAQLIDAIAEGTPTPNKTWKEMKELARLDCNMLRRLSRLARAIVDKDARGELTQEEARKLCGVTKEFYDE